jgi:hypothetical protein
MNKTILFLMVYLLLWGCKQTKQEKEESPFSTTDQSELFFQNVRAIYYSRVIMPETKVHIYTLKNQPSENLLWPVIVYNWREDQAFLMLQTDTLELPVTLFKTRHALTDSIRFDGENMLNHLEVAEWIAESLTGGYAVATQKAELFSTFAQKEAFQTVIKDYKRLVE